MSDKQRAKDAAQRARALLLAIDRDEHGCPRTLEGAIRSLILKSPDFAQYRDDALNILYCTLGTGIGWSKDGRLVDDSPNNYLNLPPDIYYGVWARDHGQEETLERLLSDLKEGASRELREELRTMENYTLDRAIAVVDEIDIRWATYRPAQNWYPISWYASHLCPPKGAQRDFIEGAFETATLIANWEPKLEGRFIKDAFSTRRFARMILPALTERLASSSPQEHTSE